ncbi:MAG: EAL domain-containing protein [Proteobacteria bacterium]|nr:EAL domain-containing protein [Pseudomonadota bacterium]
MTAHIPGIPADGRGAEASALSSAAREGRPAIRVLLVEDGPAEAELTIRELRRGGLTCECQRVETQESFTGALLEFRPDVILCDYTLPRFSGPAALKVAGELARDIPFIFVSGTIGEERAVEALRCGAVDYVLKGNLSRLVPAVLRALQEVAARAQRQRQEAQIARLTRVLRMLSGANAVMLRARRREEMLEEACRLAVSVGGYAVALIALRLPGTKAIQTAAKGTDPGTTGRLRALIEQAADSDASVIGQALRSGKSHVCNGVEDFLVPPSPNDTTQKTAPQPIVVLPIFLDQTPVGVFVVEASDAGTLAHEELGMLREVAANLSFALQYLQKDTRLKFLSHFDANTGLAKRELFSQRIGRKLTEARGDLTRLAVAVIDIEHLGVINDSFGRHTGDLLLQHVTDRLRRRFEHTQLLAQLTGGRFAVALEIRGGPSEALESLRGHIGAVFTGYFEIDEHRIPVTVKSGLAIHPDNGRDAEALLMNAEAALRDAKARGERALHYSAEAHSQAMSKLTLEHKLRVAIEQEQFELHYQPKVNVKVRTIEGVEALIRWRDPQAGLVSPAAFLPLLEESGLIVEVGDWVLRQASADCQRWRRDGLPGIRVAVNISPLQLNHPDFLPRFFEVTRSWTDPTCGLDVEIIEGMLLGDSGAAVRKLERLRAAGVRIAVDDFGTGYSSLNRLSELPIDTLKIDRCFVSRLPHDRSGRTLVSTIISLARAFDMTVVAEGVETEEQLGALWTMGCNEAQGYLLSHPVTSEELAHLLEHGKGRLMLPAARRAESSGEEAPYLKGREG